MDPNEKDQKAVDNRADQLNPNNDKYYQARGIEKHSIDNGDTDDDDYDDDQDMITGDDLEGGWYPGYDW